MVVDRPWPGGTEQERRLSEFKLKRGRKVYHIREFSSLLELTRRGLVAPDDPIFVPSVDRWVLARAIHELAPLLVGVPLRGESEDEDAVVLPLEFVEPLSESELTPVEVDETTLGVDAESGDPIPSEGMSDGGGKPGVSGRKAGGEDVWSNHSAEKILSELDAVPTVPTAGAEGWHEPPTVGVGAGLEVDRASRVARGGDVRGPVSRGRGEPGGGTGSWNGGRDTERDRSWQDPAAGAPVFDRGEAGAGRVRGGERRRVGAAPISFQDWMAEKAREGALAGDEDGVLPLLSGVGDARERPERVPVRWGRLAVISGVLLAMFGGYFLYVKVIAEMEYEPWTPPPVAVTAVPGGDRVPGVEQEQSPEPGLTATDYRLRSMIPPNVVAFRSFEQAEDRLFSELLNLKIGVADVQLIPVEGDTNRSVRRTESDVSVRLRHSPLPAEEQTGIIGLVIGKYMSRDRLKVRDLVMRIERAGQVPVVRIVPGRAAAEYFAGRINYQQYLLAVQAGTVSP